jgi:ABC-type transporter Mla MlaB component
VFPEESSVLRISILSDSTREIHFQLEGKLVGPWVEELRRLGTEALSQRKTVIFDLEQVSYADLHGVALLHEFARHHVSQLHCSQFLTEQLKEAAQ